MVLMFPSKLYGRDPESARFLQSFERVKQEGTPRLLLISGQPGVGKTEMANQGQADIARQQPCWIAAGKCDRLQHNSPYAAIITAFRTLARQILDPSRRTIAPLKPLTTALGTNGQIVVDVIPEVELLLGKQSSVPVLGAVETQNRFNLVFGNFIRSFCSPNRPLVLVLDDLQWADPATLKLLQLLLTDPETQYLFCVGTYRSNEVSADHPLTQAIETLQAAGTDIQRLQLQSLSDRQVDRFVADTLQDRSERPKALAALMFRQTAGNPLLLKQSLYSLYLNQQLFQAAGSGLWQWQLEHLQRQELFDLVSQRLARLPAPANHWLKRVACTGGRMSLPLLSAIGEQSPVKTLLQLRPALRSGLIVLQRDAADVLVCFVHDRIQQMVYDQIEPATQTAMHFVTGQLLQAANQEDNFFLMVNQFNLGTRSIAAQSQKDELCRLNLQASQKARDVADFTSALTYIHQALDLLGQSWGRNYGLTLEIYQAAIEVEYLNGHFEQSHRFANAALDQTKTALEAVSIYQLKIQAYIAQSQYQEAVELGFSVLRDVGVELTKNLPSNLTIEALDQLSEASDPLRISILKILCTIGDFAPFVDTECIPSIIITELNLYWQMGNSILSASVCVDYAFLLCAAGEIEQGNQYGELALRLLDRFDLKRLQCKVINIYHCGVKHWVNLRETLESLERAIASGLEHGDLEFTGHAVLNLCTHSIFAGIGLEEIERVYQTYTRLLQKFRLEFHFNINKIFHQVVLNLRGRSSAPAQLQGEIFDAAGSLPDLRAEHNTFALFLTYLAQGMLSYFFAAYAEALTNLNEATQYAAVMDGFAATTQLNFYQSLAILGYYRDAPALERPGLMETVEANQTQMERWARFGPVNFLHKFYLVEAELARVQSRFDAAVSFYQKAIEGARKSGYIQEEALARELAMKFCLGRDRANRAREHFKAAYRLYLQWGAVAKVQELEKTGVTNLVSDSSALIEECFFQNQKEIVQTLLGLCSNIVYISETRTIQLICTSVSLADLIRSHGREIKRMPDLKIEIKIQPSSR